MLNHERSGPPPFGDASHVVGTMSKRLVLLPTCFQDSLKLPRRTLDDRPVVVEHSALPHLIE